MLRVTWKTDTFKKLPKPITSNLMRLVSHG